MRCRLHPTRSQPTAPLLATPATRSSVATLNFGNWTSCSCGRSTGSLSSYRVPPTLSPIRTGFAAAGFALLNQSTATACWQLTVCDLRCSAPRDQANPRVCQPINPYISAATITRHGFALAGTALDNLLNREVHVWGYVDYQNLYGNDDARLILGDWWSGYGPDDHSWRFNLKAESDDEAGQSFAVSVPNDLLRDDVLRVLVRNAREGWPTKVYLLGILSTFEAPTNAVRLRGLRMDLRSSRDIRIGESAFDQGVMSGR